MPHPMINANASKHPAIPRMAYHHQPTALDPENKLGSVCRQEARVIQADETDPPIVVLDDEDDLGAVQKTAKGPLSENLLHELHAYAIRQITEIQAQEALQKAELAVPELVRSYGIGVIPSDYRTALSRDAKKALVGRRLGGSVVIPARDENGIIVDFLVLRFNVAHRGGLWPEPRGLLGSGIIHAHDDLIVTDTPRWLGRLFRQGYHNVLLVRGPQDAKNNAQRLKAAGVQRISVRAYRDAEEIAKHFSAVGIEVRVETAPVTGEDQLATPAETKTEEENAAPAEPSLSLIEFDQTKGTAIFEVGPLRYAIEVSDSDLPTRQVVARRGQNCHQDRINLSVEAQCRRFSSSAARRLSIDPQRLVAHLIECWRQIKERESTEHLTPSVQVTGDERTQTETLLRDPKLLDHIENDLQEMGWIGEGRTKGLLYLTAVSRLLPDPLWSVYRATVGAAPWRSLGIIAALMPPEECVVFHRLTEALLKRTDERALRHRLLLVDRAETLRPEGAVALRCLKEWGSIGWSQVAQAEGATSSGLLGEAKGPVAVLAAAAGDLDHRCRDSFLTVKVDETQEQTAKVLEDQRRRLSQGGIPAERAQGIIRRHHALQRLLRPATVSIPFVDRIIFPQTSVKHREEQTAFLTLIAASAILYQFQRQRDATGAIIAEESDFQNAHALSNQILGSGGDGLSDQGRQLLQRLSAKGITGFVLADLGGLIGDWTYYTYRATAEELVAMGYCTAQGGGQGRARKYTLTAGNTAVQKPQSISLLPLQASQTFRPCETFCVPSKGVAFCSIAV